MLSVAGTFGRGGVCSVSNDSGRDRRDQQPRRDQQRRNRPQRGQRQDDRTRSGDSQPDRDPVAAAAPELSEDITIEDLDADVRTELRTLPKNLAEIIGRHLVAAGELIDSDPQAALEHARYAKRKASRVPSVREALGLVAYHAGEWAEARTELRAVRRMTRVDTHVAVIADAERALGRAQQALDLAREVDTERLPKEIAVELRIVAAGARRDLGQLDAAVVALQGADLDAKQRQPWSARLYYAYADNLVAAGRSDEALRWFLRASQADEEGETDAAERAVELGAQAQDE